MMNRKDKYLPIGTVCLLKDGKKRIMIIGFCIEPEEDKGKIYDYGACLYPEGIISSDKTILFNHDQIDKIYYMGYTDEEQRQFDDKLKEIVSKVKSGEIKLDNE